ncbi:MAG: FtsX-like permease family protein [Oscillospiraceae bacterium]
MKNTKSRFIAIMAIIAIGSGFFAGVKSAGPDMKLSAADYLDKQGLADFHIMSELGLDDEDVSAAEALGISDEIYTGYSADIMLSGKDENEKIVKLYSYDPDSGINKPYVTNGRLPEKSGEIFVDERLSDNINVGDTVKIETGDGEELSDIVGRSEYTVVGKGKSPVYVSFDRGSTTIGNGVINGWAIIPEADFAYEVYTDMYISLSEADGVDPFSSEYEDIISRNTDILEAFADKQIEHRKGVITDEAYEEINDAKAELEDGRKELADAEQELADGKKEIADNEQKITDGKKEIADAEAEIADAKEQLADGETEYNDGLRAKDNLNAVIEQLNGVISKYETNAAESADVVEEIVNELDKGDFFDADETLQQLLTGYMMIPAAYDDGTKAMSKQGLEQYIAGLENNVSEMDINLASARTELDNAKQEIADGEAEIEKSKQELSDAEKEIADAKQEIADGEKEVADAKQEISDGEKEIADAEKELHDEIDDAKWYVFDRDYNPSYSNYALDCDRIDAIANVFPIFFILVAALVCCTTMTRMVEEQRTQIGTLKALGYSRFSIISQYVLYALAASIPGGFIGLLIGFNTLPPIIFKCYQAMYSQPYVIVPFRWDYAIGCILAACLCTGVSALFASRQELVSCPAQLMRPKPPKNGRRIFLERISFIWNRLKFTTKVTFRNLFRYKARLLMTVVGIAGCTALLLAGYGLQYAITSIVDKQYGDIFTYDAIIALDKNADDEAYASVTDDMDSTDIVSDKMFIMQETVDISSDSSDKYEVYLLVPENKDDLSRFIDLHERKSRKGVTISDDGVILGEKIARLLGVTVGDSVYFKEGYPLEVTGICENYTFNYVYMTDETYAKAGFDNSLRSNMILIKMTDTSKKDELSSVIIKNDTVLAVSYSSNGGDKFRDLVSSLSMIIVVIIVAAGALAFVVLFNLSNININERIRELATIKVLGFYDGEVAAYVYRENIVLTILGTLAGLGLGVWLEKFVIKTSEVDSVMFSSEIPLYCFAEAALLTLLFALLVNVTLYFRLKKIDMATSLKAIE